MVLRVSKSTTSTNTKSLFGTEKANSVVFPFRSCTKFIMTDILFGKSSSSRKIGMLYLIVDKRRYRLGVFLTTLFCFFINLLAKNSYNIAIFNSLLLGISLIFIYLAEGKFTTTPLVFILSFSLIPIFSFAPAKPLLYLLLISSILFWLVAIKFPKKKYLFATCGFLICIWGALISNGLFSDLLIPNIERLIWNNLEAERILKLHRVGAFFLPYPIRLILFGKVFYIYSFFTKIAGFVTFKNLYDTILLANIYPLILGIQTSYKRRKKLINLIALFGVGLVMVVAGINTSPDRFNSLFMAAPLLIYLITLGLGGMSKNKYILLFIISIILANASNL